MTGRLSIRGPRLNSKRRLEHTDKRLLAPTPVPTSPRVLNYLRSGGRGTVASDNPGAIEQRAATPNSLRRLADDIALNASRARPFYVA